MRMIMRSHSQRCSAFSNKRASEEPLAAEDDNDAQILDRLCLALGLLTNLVQVSDIAKDLMRQTRKTFLLYMVQFVQYLCNRARSCLHR